MSRDTAYTFAQHKIHTLTQDMFQHQAKIIIYFHVHSVCGKCKWVSVLCTIRLVLRAFISLIFRAHLCSVIQESKQRSRNEYISSHVRDKLFLFSLRMYFQCVCFFHHFRFVSTIVKVYNIKIKTIKLNVSHWKNDKKEKRNILHTQAYSLSLCNEKARMERKTYTEFSVNEKWWSIQSFK